MMMKKEDVQRLVEMTLKDFPLPCKREYEFGPYPECKTCSDDRKMLCVFGIDDLYNFV